MDGDFTVEPTYRFGQKNKVNNKCIYQGNVVGELVHGLVLQDLKKEKMVYP